MFIQVIEGKTRDPQALHRQLDVWQRDLRPGAIGYLGSTAGCTSTGDCIMIARFDSAESARRNSERPEQGRWWSEVERLFDGPVTFHDSEDVHVMQHGDLDRARFVQVMEGHVSDRARADRLEREADSMLAEARPDLIGSVTAYYGGDDFTELAYFTTEAEAREAERRRPEGEAASMMSEWEQVMKIDRYLDITDPWLFSA